MGNIIVGGLIVLVLGAIIHYLIKQRKNNSGGCPHCNGCKSNSGCGRDRKSVV